MLTDSERIKKAYIKEDGNFRIWGTGNYNNLNPHISYTETSFREHLSAVLRAQGWNDTPTKDRLALEIGCGWGRNFPLFFDLGIQPSNLHGLDLLQPFVEKGKTLYPNVNIREGDAALLHSFNITFDLVLLHTTLSAILEPDVQRAVIGSAARLLKPQGLLIVMDIVEGYQESHVKVGEDEIVFIRAVPPKVIQEFASDAGIIPIYSAEFGLKPRLRNGIFSKLGQMIKNPIHLRMFADFLGILPSSRSHFILALAKGVDYRGM